jgi:hypothetical protein
VRAAVTRNENPTVVSARVAGEEEVSADAPTAAEVPATAQKAPDKAGAPTSTKDGKPAKDKDSKTPPAAKKK